jgi:Protein of unknown function (DUF2889)
MSRPELTIHPRHGTHNPRSDVPTLPLGAIRRVSSIDAVRENDLLAPLVLYGRAQDVLASGEIKSAASIEAHVDFVGNKTLTALTTMPQRDVSSMIGLRVSRGFRRALDEALPNDVGSPLYAMLDDLPVSTLVSVQALLAGGGRLNTPKAAYAANANVCAGWASTATIMMGVEADGAPPVAVGPPVARIDDSAWPNLPTLPPNAMRRARRTDVTVDGDVIAVDSFFRDSHQGQDGIERGVHEYTVSATIDPQTFTVLTCVATPHVLPWIECPYAAASAGLIQGTSVDDLRPRVRDELTGVGTCTHLNDQLRSLADVRTLASTLALMRTE